VEPDLKELLHHKADDMRLPLELPPVTLRRARRRRGRSAAFASMTVILFVTGTVTGVQLLTRTSNSTIGESPGPTETSGGSTASSEPVPGPSESAVPEPSAITNGRAVDLTPEAAAVRREIQAAAERTEFATLVLLLDPTDFRFRGTGPASATDLPDAAIVFWKRLGPDVCRTLMRILDMPWAVEPGPVTTYVWPAVAEYTSRQRAHLAPEWRSALRGVYPDFDRRWSGGWLQHGYDGWRVEITADGRWIGFFAGGAS
jgi:hypothetical protein